MAGRKAMLINDIGGTLKNLRRGSKKSREIRAYILKQIPNDLININRLVPRLSNLNAEIIKELIQYWESKGNSNKTIFNKISSLRTIITKNTNQPFFPSNKELNIKLTQILRTTTTTNVTVDMIKQPLMRDICGLQYHFGLMKLEAIRFEILYIKPQEILIPRLIAYNSKSRYIPITTTLQKELLDSITQHYNGKIPSRKYKLNYLSMMHQKALMDHDISDPNYFRYQYILKRYNKLTEQENLKNNQALKILRQELGYYDNRQIKKVLLCLGNF